MKRKLLLAFCALLIGWSYASAQFTKAQLVSDGWTEITDVQSISGESYYVFVASSTEVMMKLAPGNQDNNSRQYTTPWFKTSVDPVTDLYFVWTLTANNHSVTPSFSIACAAAPLRYLQTEGNKSYLIRCSDNGGGSKQWYEMKLAYDGTNKYWTIQQCKYSTYLGPWENKAAANGQEFAGNRAANDAGLGKFKIYKMSKTNFDNLRYRKASSSYSVDYTDKITNPDFASNAKAQGWTATTKTSGNYNFNGAVEAWCFSPLFDINQTLSELPVGNYRTSVQAHSSTAKIYAESGDTEKETAINNNVSGDGFAGKRNTMNDMKTGTSSVDITVLNGSLKLGLKETADNAWTVFDNFRLFYKGIMLSELSEVFNGTMAANQWYSFEVTSDGDYTLSATENVVYAVEDQLLSANTNSATSTISLKKGTAYFMSTTNRSLVITKITPVVESGDYYLYDATNKVFLSRGANFGARATVDKYGIPFTWNNYSKTIVFKDWTSKELFFDKADHSSCWLYTDGSNKGVDGQFSFETADAEGGLYLRDNAKTVYINHDGSVLNVPTTSSTNATVWTIMTKAEHDAIVNAYPTENKTNVIAAASLTSETDAAGFESWLAANRAAKDKTSSVGTAKFTGEAGDWTWTRNTNGAKDATYGTDWTEAFQTAVGTWSQTITGLQEGVYKVTVNAFERAAGYATCNTLGEAGWEPVTAYFMANDQQIQLKSWYSDKEETNNPNTTGEAATAFNNDKYKNQLYTYVGDDGKLTITIGKPGKADGSWVLFNNVTLTYYDTAVDEGDATAIIDEATTTMESPMKHSLYAALSTAKETFGGARTVPNYNALRAAIDNTATSIASYANMNTNYLTPLNTYFATTNFVQSDAYNTYLGYKNSYDNYKTTGADVENAIANALSITQGGGTNYTSTYSLMMLPNWTIGTTPASTTNSGFYVNTWSTENKGTGDAKDFANPFFEYWVGSGSLAANTLTGTLTGLTPNKAYDVTAKVRVQGDSKVAGSITMEVVGGAPVDVTAGDAIMDGDNPTGRYIKSYTATGVTDADGNLELKFNIAANSNVSWLSFRDVNYEESGAVISNDFTAINTAISVAEAHTLGFESGEYAPYNNVDALNKLEAAKNLDQNHYYISSVISSTATTLSEATWTANDGSVECVYNGNFAEGKGSPAANIQQYGWTRTNGWGQFMNDGFESSTAYYNQPGSLQYGNAGVYTMPLKAQTIYRLQFKYAKWDGNFAPTVSVLNEGSGMAAQTFENASSNYKDGYNSVDMVFVTAAAGNYVLSLSASSNYVITGVSITKAASQVLEFSENADAPAYAPGTYPNVTLTRTIKANTWNTFVVPFAINNTDLKAAFGNDVAIAEYSETADGDNSTVAFTTMPTPAVAANTPVLLKTSAEGTNYEFTNRTVAAAGEAKVEGEENYDFVGSYKASITLEDGDYFISSNNLYKNDGATVTLKGTRAYIKVKGTNNVKILNFIIGDDTATGVEAPEVTEAEEEEILYNTAGVRVGKDYKGIVINQKGEKRLQK